MGGQTLSTRQMHGIHLAATRRNAKRHAYSPTGPPGEQANSADAKVTEHPSCVQKSQSSGLEISLQRACLANNTVLVALCKELHTSTLVSLAGKQASFCAISWKMQSWLWAEEQEIRSASSDLSQSVGSSEINLKHYQQPICVNDARITSGGFFWAVVAHSSHV